VTFSSLSRRKIVADFNSGRLTSDVGGLLLREIDRKLGLTDALGGPHHHVGSPDRAALVQQLPLPGTVHPHRRTSHLHLTLRTTRKSAWGKGGLVRAQQPIRRSTDHPLPTTPFSQPANLLMKYAG